jgi:hypothetical protein
MASPSSTCPWRLPTPFQLFPTPSTHYCQLIMSSLWKYFLNNTSTYILLVLLPVGRTVRRKGRTGRGRKFRWRLGRRSATFEKLRSRTIGSNYHECMSCLEKRTVLVPRNVPARRSRIPQRESASSG